MNHSRIILKPGKERALRRYHPWIFSGAAEKVDGNPAPGDVVEVFSHRNEYLATGHFLKDTIMVKVFDFNRSDINPDFWYQRLDEAFKVRSELGLTSSPLTNAYRLVHSEGDQMPGLVIDYYNGVAVIQCHSPGMHRLYDTLCEGLKKLFGKELVGIVDKSADTLPDEGDGQRTPEIRGKSAHPDQIHPALPSEEGCGNVLTRTILETGHHFKVDIIRGQKTGFFLDQRSNRMFAQFYARGRKVLNAFCYSGAFTIYAFKGGATEVHSLDRSKQALEWTAENLDLNGLSHERHQCIHEDAKKFLAEKNEKYDLIILDPPAFAKSHQVTNNALHAYIHINRSALCLLNRGGILMTFSCSQAISREMFRSAIQSAAIEAGRRVTLLHHLGQAPDHPVSVFHPEGEYLKGLILLAE